MQAGGIILCGGQSSRMGLPKATLPFGPEFMLQRVHRLLSEVVQPIVVVAAADQTLPPLPAGALFAHDEQPNRGPLEGLRVGLKCMQPRCDWVYVTSCDVPLLQPALVQQLLALATKHDAVVPQEDQFSHPLSAAYHTRLLSSVEKLLSGNQFRLHELLKQVNTRYVPVDELRSSDPELLSLRNLNHPDEYVAALRSAGLVDAASIPGELPRPPLA